MTVKGFETRLDWTVCDIGDMLKDSDASNVDIKDLKNLIKSAYNICTNDFEEQCVTERITEVITEWIETMKAA